MKTQPWVKTSFGPGSQVVTDYLTNAGLMTELEKLRFYLTGYGCQTCIGNSGPLSEAVSKQIAAEGLVVSAVLSGNRNFEGRVHPEVRANYLASPPLVVAYALAGRVDIDWEKEPVGKGNNGADVFLKDIWPTHEEVQARREFDQAGIVREFTARCTKATRWKALHADRRLVLVGRRVHAHRQPAVLPRNGHHAPGDSRLPGAGAAPWRQHHHRPHLARRQHQEGFARRKF